MSPKPTLIGLFAGVGGIELGFKQAGFSPIAANEMDPYAIKTYRYGSNNENIVVEGDVTGVSSEMLLGGTKHKKVTVLTGGFPCQPFSVAGRRKGFEDERGNVFWQIHRLIMELEPEVVFLENVKNLLTHDNHRTFTTIRGALMGEIASPQGKLIRHGYTVKSGVLNAKDFGIPQNRERVFIVAFRDEDAAKKFDFFEKPPQQVERRPLSDFIDFESRVDERFYYTEKDLIYPALVTEVVSSDTVYQWRRQYVRANKSNLCPTLTANMGMGGHNVPIVLTKFGIRKLMPSECFNLMGFENLEMPPDMAISRLYKQAGNAVVVPVIKALAVAIKKALG